MKRRIATFALLVLTLLTVAFIFLRSLKSPAASTEESDGVRKFLLHFFSPDRALGNFVLTYVRKIAHFVEYAVLGTEIYFLVFVNRKNALIPHAVSLGAGLLVASADEFLQRFSGRGASVLDVLLDFSGFLTATLGFWFVLFTVSKLKNKKSRIQT